MEFTKREEKVMMDSLETKIQRILDDKMKTVNYYRGQLKKWESSDGFQIRERIQENLEKAEKDYEKTISKYT